MRDTTRINRILEKFKELWLLSGQDQRFFQLLSNYSLLPAGDPFYFEDDTLEKLLDSAIAKAISEEEIKNLLCNK